MRYCQHSVLVSCVFLGLDSAASAQAVKPDLKLLVNSADEPVVKTMSLDTTAAFLDHQSRAWPQIKKCGTCHTNHPYLLARAQLAADPAALQEVRVLAHER